ncbi:unnamed protein product [Chrysoparadoxa australica]
MLYFLALVLALQIACSSAFTLPPPILSRSPSCRQHAVGNHWRSCRKQLMSVEGAQEDLAGSDSAVVATEVADEASAGAPGEIDISKSLNFQTPEAAKAVQSEDDGKQARVLVYIILSLVPCLLLLPLMSTNELRPLDPELIKSQMMQ